MNINSAGRGTARRVLGTRAIASYAEVVDAYTRLLRCLAKTEHLPVIVMGGSQYGGRLQAANPGMKELLARFGIDMHALSDTHRFIWFDTEASVDGPDRESCFLADGVHRSAAGHARLAGMLVPVVRSALPAPPE